MRTCPVTWAMFGKYEGRAAIAGHVQRSNFEFGSNRAAAVKDAFWRANHVFATFWDADYDQAILAGCNRAALARGNRRASGRGGKAGYCGS